MGAVSLIAAGIYCGSYCHWHTKVHVEIWAGILTSGKAPEDWRSPRRFAYFRNHRIARSVLDCGGPPPLFPWAYQTVPMLTETAIARTNPLCLHFSFPPCRCACYFVSNKATEHEPNHASKISGAGRRHGGCRIAAQPGVFAKHPIAPSQVQCVVPNVQIGKASCRERGEISVG